MNEATGTDSPVFTSLEPLETSSRRWREQTGPQLKLHARWFKERERILDALENTEDENCKKRFNRIQGCCAVPEIRKDSNGLPCVRFNACRDRLCPRCQRQRGLSVRERVLSVVQTFNAPRFATLTLQHREDSLDSMRRRLAECFRELRKQPEWKERVTSGVWVIETTLNAKTERWHLHLHLILDGQFFPQGLLSKIWHRVTGDSMICDIRAVPDRAKAVAYIADYVSKPSELANWRAEKIREFASAMHGVRMVHTFGKAHKATVESDEPESEKKASTFVIHAVVLRRLARDGNLKAQFVVTTLCGWRKNICEALGFDWKGNTSAPPLLGNRDVESALAVCDELERGLLIDLPPRHEPTREEIHSEQLWPSTKYV